MATPISSHVKDKNSIFTALFIISTAQKKMGYTLVFFLDVIRFAVMFFSFAVTIVGHPIYYLVKNNE